MDKQLKQDAWIEDVLKSQPLASMPRSVTVEVMSRIPSAELKRPAILVWSDFALSVVLASCLAALWFTAQNLPPILWAKLRIQSILIYQDFLVHSHWLVPAGIFGVATLLAAITIPTLLKLTMDHRR